MYFLHGHTPWSDFCPLHGDTLRGSSASTSPVTTLHSGAALAIQYLRPLSGGNICPILILFALVYTYVNKFAQFGQLQQG